MNLYRKYRPKAFDEVLGNGAEIESLKKKIDKEDRPQAYLISGASGTGKTTLARILAQQFGANDLGIIEVNTADNRGIDTARALIDKSRYTMPDGSPRVFIIDEVHKTTNEWQSAMLKPLEDTPKDIYFILCTTEPHKLLKAIRTRCTPVVMGSLPSNLLLRLISRVVVQEKLEIDKDVMMKIAEKSEGSPRQALVFLEKIQGMQEKNQMMDVLDVGGDDEAEIMDLCRLLIKGSGWDAVSAILANLKTDPESARLIILGYMNTVLLRSGKGHAAEVMECFLDPVFNAGKAGLTLSCFQAVNLRK